MSPKNLPSEDLCHSLAYLIIDVVLDHACREAILRTLLFLFIYGDIYQLYLLYITISFITLSKPIIVFFTSFRPSFPNHAFLRAIPRRHIKLHGDPFSSLGVEA